MVLSNLIAQGAPITGNLNLLLHKHNINWNSDCEFFSGGLLTGIHFAVLDIAQMASHDLFGQFAVGGGFFIVAYFVNLIAYPYINYCATSLKMKKATQDLFNRPISWLLTAVILSPMFGHITTGLIALAPIIGIAICTSILARSILSTDHFFNVAL